MCSSDLYKLILWAVEKGITSGTSANKFSPNQKCSSAHIITFLYRSKNAGSDGWYKTAAYWADQQGMLDGTGIAITPNTMCPRGAVVTFLYRAMNPAVG